MNDMPDNFEAELQRMNPASLRPALVQRIGEGLAANSPSPWAQRRLLAAIWAGALAACVNLAMLMTQNESSPVPGAPLQVSSNSSASADGPAYAVAMADPKWIELLK